VRNLSPLLLLISFFFFSCKKDKKPTDYGTDLKFTKTISASSSTNEIVACCASDRSINYIVRNISGDQFELTKCDIDGAFIYQKPITVGPGKIQKMIGDQKGDGFYILSSTFNYTTTGNGTANPAMVNRNTLANSQVTGCNYDDAVCYQFETAFIPGGYTRLTNNTVLRKIDGEGNLLWQKNFDGNYFDGNSLDLDAKGNIVLLTGIKNAYDPQLNNQLSGVLPYYKFVLGPHTFKLTLLAPAGIILAESPSIEFYEPDANSMKLNLSVSKERILVNGVTCLFEFDPSLNSIPTAKPISNTCYNYFTSAVACSKLSQFYISGRVYLDQNQDNYLVARVHSNDRAIKEYASINFFKRMDDNGNFYNIYWSGISKYDGSNNKLYSRFYPLYSNGQIVGNSAGFNDRGSFFDARDQLTCFVDCNGKIEMYKFDSDGNCQ
jgi:hypothetical protein